MGNEETELLGGGMLLTLLALGFLIALVRRELAPLSRLNPSARWMLVGAFGTGLFAFALKLGALAAIHYAPQRTIAPLLAAYPSVPAAPEHAPRPTDPIVIARPAAYAWRALPLAAPSPADNPATAAKVALGERLFNEKRLSRDGAVSCASCHDLYRRAGADGVRTARGFAGQRGRFNTPTVWNAAFQGALFWDGRARSLEAQAGGPILNPREMALSSPREAEQRLAVDRDYRAQFAAAFGDDAPISFARITQAIAAFERTLITPDTPYDRFVRGEAGALNAAQLRGMALFESVGCVNCHGGANFSDASLAGSGAPLRVFPANPTPYERRYALLTPEGARGVWRVPSLRNVALTGPWLHNGSVDDLAEVVRIMASAQLARTDTLKGWVGTEAQLARMDRSPLSERDVRDIVAFLHALSGTALAARQAAP